MILIKIYNDLKNKLNLFLIFLNSSKGSHKDRTVRSGYWQGISSLIIRFSELIRSIILARILMPEDFGLMSIILIVYKGIETLTQFNFKTVLIHKQKSLEESINTAWVLNIIRGCILALCVYLSAPFIADFYNEPILSRAIKFISIIFFLNGFSNINIVLFDKELNFKKVAFLKISIIILNVLIAILLALYMRNIWALVYSYIIGTFCEIVLTYLIQKRKPVFHFNKHLAKELFSYSLFITGSGILLFLTTKIDDALIGKVVGMSALGYYAYAYRIANLPSNHITSVISEVMLPSYSSIQNDLILLRSTFLKVIKFISFMSIPSSVGIFITSDFIVYLILGQKWMPLVPALKILCIFGLLRSLGATTSPLFQAIGKPHIIFFVMLIKFTFIILIIYPLTVRYGIEGTAWAVTISMMLEQIYLWNVLSNILQIKISIIFNQIKTALLGSLGMFLILFSIKQYFELSLRSFFFFIFIGFAIYFVITITVDRSYYKELIKTLIIRN